jgi:AcrR family transcriptional regulator
MSKVRSKRGPYARSLQRRETIAQTVLDIVDEHGYEAVTTALVAERSGSNEATVLYHFPTKDHLLLASLRHADDLAASASGFSDNDENPNLDESAASLDDLALHVRFTRLEDAGPRERLLQYLRGLAATPGHPAREYLAERDSRAIAIFSKLIAARQRSGLAHPALDPKDVAAQFIALWEGLGQMASVNEGLDANRLLQAGLRMLTGEPIMEMQNALRTTPWESLTSLPDDDGMPVGRAQPAENDAVS